MKLKATLLAALAVAFAHAATVRTATENYVTNEIAKAEARIGDRIDYSTNNAALVATIEAKAPAPGMTTNDVENIMQATMSLSGRTFDLAMMRGMYEAVSNIIGIMGGAITNYPSFNQ